MHEELATVVDQCRNLETFAPRAALMVHVSPAAPFSPDHLREALAAGGCRRSHVNRAQVATTWGHIVAAHFANAQALQPLCRDDAILSLHSSNDMLLCELPSFAAGAAIHETREVSPDAIWSTARAYCASELLPELLGALDCPRAVGSQVEGSAYPLAMVLRLAERIAAAELGPLPPIAEELVFATFAARHLGPPAGPPYVLFRPNLPGALAGRFVPRALRRDPFAAKLQGAVNRLTTFAASDNAAPEDVEAILAGRPLAVPGWPYGTASSGPRRFHGIKRISRRFDDPLRARIRRHTEATRTLSERATV